MAKLCYTSSSSNIEYLNHLQLLLWIPIIFNILPTVAAQPEESPFLDIPLQAFSQFIWNNFSSKSLILTALVILFTITDNPDLLNLHSRQQNPKYTGEKYVAVMFCS
jgi:hypothetical protein